jgi:hypothetical protein
MRGLHRVRFRTDAKDMPLRLRTPTELGESLRLVLNIGCHSIADVREVERNGVTYAVEPPHQAQGYYAVEFDHDARVLHLVPTRPQDSDRFVRSWKTAPIFDDAD